MSTHYEAPMEVRELEKALRDFTYGNGFKPLRVFEDFLKHIINGWTLKGYPGLTNWSYTTKQTKEFFKMHQIWIKIMQKQIESHGWYDVFGDLFETLIIPTEAQYNGQMFTPIDACELMAQLLYGGVTKEKPRLKKINDDAAGSGRTLLAANAHYPGNFLVAQDIDYTCCQMAVCNFLVNSCVGLVICRNTLTWKDFKGAWLVNEFYYRTNKPSIRPLTEEELNAIQNSEKWRALLVSPEKYEGMIRMGDMWDAYNQLMNRYDKDKGTTDNG